MGHKPPCLKAAFDDCVLVEKYLCGLLLFSCLCNCFNGKMTDVVAYEKNKRESWSRIHKFEKMRKSLRGKMSLFIHLLRQANQKLCGGAPFNTGLNLGTFGPLV